MARRRTKTSLTEQEVSDFMQSALALHRACIRPMSELRTDTAAYRAMQELALTNGWTLKTVTGQDIWHGQMRTSQSDT